MKNLLLLALIFWSASLVYSQDDGRERTKLHFGIGVNFNETQIKNYLLNKAFTGDRVQYAVGVNFMTYVELRNKWYAGLGGTFQAISYLNRRTFEKTQMVATPINDHEEVFQNIVGEVTVNFKFQVDESYCANATFTEDFPFLARFNTINKIQTLGIPVLFGRTLGSKRMKWYAEISMIPNLVLKKEIKYRETKGLGLGRSYLRTCRVRMHPMDVQTVGSLMDTQIAVTNYHLKNSRLDATVEIGIKEKFKKRYYKIGIFYGESLRPFTQIEGNNYYGQMLGCKLELGFFKFKS